MAGSDIFSRAAQNLGGTFAVDSASMEFSSVAPLGGAAAAGAGAGDNFGVGMITQNVSIQYQQQVNRLYEVGTNNTYLIGGRTQGNLGVGRIIGPKQVAKDFYAVYGNLCNVSNNQIDMYIATACKSFGAGDPAPAPADRLKYSCVYVVITGIGITVAAENMIFNEQLQMMFVSLELS